MLDRDQAMDRASDFLAQRSKAWPESRVRIVEESSFVDGDKFVALYNSIAFLDEGDGGAELGGNNPIEVDMKSGECRFISIIEAFGYMDRGLIR